MPGTWHTFWEELNIVLNSAEDLKPFMDLWWVRSLVVMSELIARYPFPVSFKKNNNNSRLYCTTASNFYLHYVLTNTHCRHETEQCKFWLPKLKVSQHQITALQMSNFFHFSFFFAVVLWSHINTFSKWKFNELDYFSSLFPVGYLTYVACFN